MSCRKRQKEENFAKKCQKNRKSNKKFIDATREKSITVQQVLSAKSAQKPSNSKQKITGEATYFTRKAHPWEAKGFAIIEERDIDRWRKQRPLTEVEREKEQRELENEQRFHTGEVERMRNYYKTIDDAHKELEDENREKNVLLEEDRKKRAQILEKALLAKHEQSEIVQNVNRAIGNAKCRAMWLQQINERQSMQNAQQQYELRQQEEALQYQQTKLATQDQEDEQKRIKRDVFATEVRKQIEDRQKLRFIEEERTLLELQMVRDVNEAMKQEKRLEAQRILDRKTEYRQQLHNNLQAAADFRSLLCEQERKDDMRVINYLQEIEVRRAKQKAQKDYQAAQLKRKQDYLFEKQKKVIDSEIRRNELRFLDESERLERKYRDTERQDAEKRIRMLEDMRESHRRQMDIMNYEKACHFIQLQEDLRQHNNQILAHKDTLKEESQKSRNKKLALRTAVAAQIECREMQRRRDIDQAKLNTDKIREAEEQNRKEQESVIQMKLDNLRRQNCLPAELMNSLEVRVNGMRSRKVGK